MEMIDVSISDDVMRALLYLTNGDENVSLSELAILIENSEDKVSLAVNEDVYAVLFPDRDAEALGAA
jgi:hypothetical protein